MAFGLFFNELCIVANDMIHVVCTSNVSNVGLYGSKLVTIDLKHFHHDAGLIK